MSTGDFKGGVCLVGACIIAAPHVPETPALSLALFLIVLALIAIMRD